MTVKAHQSDNSTVLEQYAFMKRDMAVNLLTADRKATSFEKVDISIDDIISGGEEGIIYTLQLPVLA